MLQALRKNPSKDFSERVARAKPEGMVAAEQRLRAARQARSDHAEHLRKVIIEYNSVEVTPIEFGAKLGLRSRLEDEISRMEKKSPDLETEVAVAREMRMREAEAFAPTFYRMAGEVSGELLKHVDGAIAAIEAVASSLEVIKQEAASIALPNPCDPQHANLILRDLRQLAKVLGNV